MTKKLQNTLFFILLSISLIFVVSRFLPVDPEAYERLTLVFQEKPEEVQSLLVSGKVGGPDISKWQGYPVDFAKMKAAGADFVFIRIGFSSGGYNYADTYWQYNATEAVRVGIPCGHYYYIIPGGSAVTQATFFANLVLQSPCRQLPAVMDVEDDGGLSTTALADWLKLFADTLEGKLNEKPIIYTRASFWNVEVARRAYWQDYKLWVAHYFSSPDYKPTIPLDWIIYTFHQWTSTASGSVYGALSTYIDLNTYNGTLDEFHKEFEIDDGTRTLNVAPGRYFLFTDVPLVIEYRNGTVYLEFLNNLYLPIIR